MVSNLFYEYKIPDNFSEFLKKYILKFFDFFDFLIFWFFNKPINISYVEFFRKIICN